MTIIIVDITMKILIGIAISSVLNMLFGLNPVSGRRGLPVFGKPGIVLFPISAAFPYVPVLQLLVAAISTQIGWFAGSAFKVVENPVTLVLYSQFPFTRPYLTINVFIPA